MYASLPSRRVEPQDRQTYYLCNPYVLLVYYRFLKLSSQILRLIRGASLRQTKLIIRYITFDTLVFWLNLTWIWIHVCCFVSYAIRKIYIWTISKSRDNNFHHDCYKLYIIISWVAICKFMQFNIIVKTIFEYIHKKFRFVHTNTFCEYRKKLRASPRVHLVHFLGGQSPLAPPHTHPPPPTMDKRMSAHPFHFACIMYRSPPLISLVKHRWKIDNHCYPYIWPSHM